MSTLNISKFIRSEVYRIVPFMSWAFNTHQQEQRYLYETIALFIILLQRSYIELYMSFFISAPNFHLSLFFGVQSPI